MSFFLPARPWNREPQTPERWLELATEGLEAGAAEQVRAESLAQLAGAQQAGQSQAEVLGGWGDPNAANARLRRSHLQGGEAARIPAGYARGWPGLRAAYCEHLFFTVMSSLLVLLAFWMTLLREPAPRALWLGVIYVLILLLPLLRWYALSGPAQPPVTRVWRSWLTKPETWLALLMVGRALWQLAFPDAGGPSVQWWHLIFVIYVLSELWLGLKAARKVQAQSGEQVQSGVPHG
ncbi:hypothetical protein [Deinococcus radiophilus]|uniref:Uncharacterized protein n=1 Tax=Deinococcus radiophilus TaxID=32062 RepID=A0A431W227_9DEIO|nr:hypothetical protein [Deinococcus radiophilus]RTR29483.1 hypothetical protein EJ104_03615 [Deinococcus radiophilus]UFA50682.1 hypothetical protein LMT64_01880 [Deinococcus radiophilus]